MESEGSDVVGAQAAAVQFTYWSAESQGDRDADSLAVQVQPQARHWHSLDPSNCLGLAGSEGARAVILVGGVQQAVSDCSGASVSHAR